MTTDVAQWLDEFEAEPALLACPHQKQVLDILERLSEANRWACVTARGYSRGIATRDIFRFDFSLGGCTGVIETFF